MHVDNVVEQEITILRAVELESHSQGEIEAVAGGVCAALYAIAGFDGLYNRIA